MAEDVVMGSSRRADWRLLVFGYALFAVLDLAGIAVCFWLRIDAFTARSRLYRAIPITVTLVLGLCAGAALARYAPTGAAERVAARLKSRAPVMLVGLCFLSLAVATVLAVAALHRFPVSGDEYAYLLQSQIFRLGRLWLDPAPIQKFVDSHFIFDIDGKMVSQYPPGWPALLAAAGALRVPDWLVNPILGALTVPALYLLARHTNDQSVAIFGALSFALSAFFLFNSASYFNHTLVTFAGVVFVLAVVVCLDEPGWLAATGMGVGFAIVAVTRHYDAVLLALPAGAAWIVRASRRQWLFGLIAVVMAMPFLMALLAYYGAVTGNPLQTPMTLVHPWDRLLGPNHHAVKATEIMVGRIIELAEWVSPLFVVLYFWALFRTIRDKKFRFFDFYGMVFLFGYWLYWGGGGNRWGPRYIYTALPFMMVTVAARVVDTLRRREHGFGSRAILHISALSILATTLQLPFLALDAARVVTEFEDLYDQVASRTVHNAVVLLTSGTGVTWGLATGNLTRNGVSLDRDVVYAHTGNGLVNGVNPVDLNRAVEALRGYFPDRAIWVYRREAGHIRGQLAPLSSGEPQTRGTTDSDRPISP